MRIFITGGAGFIGINSANYFIDKGWDVDILDNFSRAGARSNIKWLKEKKKKFSVVEGDVRFDHEKLRKGVKNADLVIHLAGQVAVTSSVINPREDFEENALGTFNVLEAIRTIKVNPILIYSSTNKVYGSLEDLKIIEKKTRYEIADKKSGISEEQCLDFHSPYGCSKGVGDQYVRDYSRIYGLNTIVFRQSCIYGSRQFGIEDQGWVAWFIIALTKNRPITIFGNGKQVRDLLYVEDLIKAYELAAKNINKTKGKVYNIGGGPKNTISIWIELKPILEKLFNRKIGTSFAKIRPGDQPIYVSNIKLAEKDFGWKPEINVEKGVEKLFNWVQLNKEVFKSIK